MFLTVKCNECGFQSEVRSEPAPNSCPVCGFMPLLRHVHVVAPPMSLGSIHDSVTVQVKNPSLPSKKKLRKKIISGAELCRKTGEYLDKYRLIDRDNNHYIETVKDPASGAVIHHCDESLSEHRGHGSAKKGLKSKKQQSNL